MQVKRYIAPDMRRALQKVRDDLGEEAVIISHKTLDGGIEIIASLHSKEELMEKWGHQKAVNAMAHQVLKKEEDIRQVLEVKAEKSKLFSNQQERSARKNDSLEHKKIQDLKHEISLLKDVIKTQMIKTSWGNFNYSQPITSYLFKQISLLGFSMDIAFDWLEEVKTYEDMQSAWQATLDHLTHQIPVKKINFSPSRQNVIALVGSAGSGKTTTIAKLAAQYVLERGSDQVAFISTDTYRIGAQEQLQTIAQVMGVPCRVVESADQLDQALTDFYKKNLVLIDTAGLTKHDAGWKIQKDILNTLKEKLKILLVLPCSQQPLVIQRSIESYGNFELDGCILTKLDEASSLGEILSALMKESLPITYVADGISIPQDIHMGDQKSIMQHSIDLAKNKSVGEDSVIQLFDSYLNKSQTSTVLENS